jgi:putative endonuclease
MAGPVPAIHEGVAALQTRFHYADAYGAAWIYILTNRPNGILYVGVTSDLARRIWEHRERVVAGFTKRYSLKRLVYVERHADIPTAIQREKNMKHWSRTWKVRLVPAMSPSWEDLHDQIV